MEQEIHPASWKAGSRRALIVFPESPEREAMRAFLSPFGRCDVAEGGEQALHLHIAAMQSGQAYRLIVLSQELPDQPGMETLSRMREAESLPVYSHRFLPARVVLFAGPAEKQRLLSAGAAGCACLPRPFDPSRMEPVLEGFFPILNSLIVDADRESTEFLRRHLSSLGQVEVARDGRLAVQKLKASGEDSIRFHLVLLELDLGDMDGFSLLARLRILQQQQILKAGAPRAVLTTSRSERDIILRALQAGCSGFLLKPYEERKLDSTLSTLGIEREAPPPSGPSAWGADARVRDEIRRAAFGLVREFSSLGDREFRNRLEQLFRSGSPTFRETAEVFSELIGSPEVAAEIRLQVIRTAGYVHAPSFLEVLRRTIEQSPDFHTAKEALVAVSKYSDRTAFQILDRHLRKISDPRLIEEIGQAISRIRQDDPILSLLPRFLNDREEASFPAAVETLQKILKPADAPIFYEFLMHPSEKIRQGALRILTSSAGRDALPMIWHHCRKSLDSLAASPEASDAAEAESALVCLRDYFRRFPDLASIGRADLERIRPGVQDPRRESMLAEILAIPERAHTPPALRVAELLEAGVDWSEEVFSRRFLEALEAQGEPGAKDICRFLETAPAGHRLVALAVDALSRGPKGCHLPPLQAAAERLAFPIQVRKQAIQAIAAMDDDRALQSLTVLLERVRNSFLTRFVQGEILRLKERLPFLGLIPQFLLGQKDPRAFQAAMRLLRKAVQAPNLAVFAAYLDEAEDPMVRMGAFELLCEKGGPAEEEAIVRFARRELALWQGAAEGPAPPPKPLLAHLYRYISRHPAAASAMDGDIRPVYEKNPDLSTRTLLLPILMKNPQGNFVQEAIRISQDRPDLRESLLEPLASHAQGRLFLLEEWEKRSPVRDKILAALLRQPEATARLVEKMPRLDRISLLHLLSHIPAENYAGFRERIGELLSSPDEEICQAAMDQMRANFDFENGRALFQPEFENRFQDVSPGYFSAVARLFPLEALHRFFARPLPASWSPGQLRARADLLFRLLEFEPVLQLGDPSRPNFMAFYRELASGPFREDFSALFRSAQRWRCQDMVTFSVFQETLNLLQKQRSEGLGAEESAELKKCRDYLPVQLEEVKSLESALKGLELILSPASIPWEALERFLVSQPHAACLAQQKIAARLKEGLGEEPESEGSRRRDFRFPLLEAMARGRTAEYRAFCVWLENKGVLALLRDQIRRIFPWFEVREKQPPREADFLIADFRSFERLAAQEKPQAHRVLILLNHPSEFAGVRSYNPATFPMPVSLYRVIRFLMQEWLG